MFPYNFVIKSNTPNVKNVRCRCVNECLRHAHENDNVFQICFLNLRIFSYSCYANIFIYDSLDPIDVDMRYRLIVGNA